MPYEIKKRPEWWHKVNAIFTFTTVVLVPLWLFAIGLMRGHAMPKWNWVDVPFPGWPWCLIALGLIAVTSRLIYVNLFDNEEFRDLHSEFKFVVSHAHSA